jgi:hypothetical protein
MEMAFCKPVSVLHWILGVDGPIWFHEHLPEGVITASLWHMTNVGARKTRR